jgi:uncharacterized protein YegL
LSHPLVQTIGMNNKYTEIAFVLDRSGSMESCREAAITGFNRFLAEQQNAPGHAKLTLVLFDNEYLVPVQSVPVQEVLPLDAESYVPRGATALLDAIAQTIDDLGARLSNLPESARPSQVIVPILTDGYENASEKFGWRDVAARIRHQGDVYRWSFLFLGANQDAIATAAQMNIPAAHASAFVADAPGSRSVQRAVSRKVTAMRAMSMGSPSIEERIDAIAPLSDMVCEEDKTEREE